MFATAVFYSETPTYGPARAACFRATRWGARKLLTWPQLLVVHLSKKSGRARPADQGNFHRGGRLLLMTVI